MSAQPTERIARETLLGLLEEIIHLTAPAQDNNPDAWHMAEDKLIESAKVCAVTAGAIQARDLRPVALAPAFLDAMKMVRPA